jgi:hypothetical protein
MKNVAMTTAACGSSVRQTSTRRISCSVALVQSLPVKMAEEYFLLGSREYMGRHHIDDSFLIRRRMVCDLMECFLAVRTKEKDLILGSVACYLRGTDRISSKM